MNQNIYGSTACYLLKDDKILFIKFNEKWGQIYAPPGGKMDGLETPTECIIREFREETGLELINPKLKGISYWHKKDSGIIFVYVAKEFCGEIEESQEGRLFWLTKEESMGVKQFPMNELFFTYLFEKGIFEGKFFYDENDMVLPEKVISYSMKKI